MKKQLLLVTSSILALVSLGGCDDNNSAKLEEVSKALENTQGAVNFSGTLTSLDIDEGTSEDEGDVDVTITDTFFEWSKNYKDGIGNPVSYRYTLKKDSEGYMSYDQLTIMNQVVNSRFINPGSDKEMLYDDYCYNPLKLLKVDDFEIIDGRYFLKSGAASVFNGLMSMCSTSMWHYYECEVSTASFEIETGTFKSVTFVTKPQSNGYYVPSDFCYDATLDILFPGEITETPVTAKTHRSEHDVLKNALDNFQKKISGGNYTVHVVDKEDGGSFYGEYDVYATEDNFLTSFRPAIYPYVEGFDKQEDGSFRKYYLYLYDETSSNGTVTHSRGDKVYVTEKSKYYSIKRSDIEMTFSGFAPEFFIKSGSSFTTSNSFIIDQITRLVCPFTEKLDEYMTPNRLTFNLDDSNEIVSWGFKMFDYYSGYADTFTYTLKDVGTTVIPTVEEMLKANQESED